MSLREVLRTETRASHKALDALVGRYDIRLRDDFGAFLTMHLDALRALRPRLSEAADMRTEIDGMIADLADDLASLGHAPADATMMRGGGPLHPDAVRYVVLGARIGLGQLRRYWAASPCPQVRSADAFLSKPMDHRRWKDLCARLSALSASDAQARIVEDANAIFDIFVCAFSRLSCAQEV
ncbi:biliverdin-producing heme oxygenase [Jannaschia sp.]|nr:biliverdin-producing heme oxygenase [Jannaschia sp.]